MSWFVAISCAVGVQCGLPGEVRGKTPHLTETECRLAGDAAIEFVGYDKARFVVRCVRA